MRTLCKKSVRGTLAFLVQTLLYKDFVTLQIFEQIALQHFNKCAIWRTLKSECQDQGARAGQILGEWCVFLTEMPMGRFFGMHWKISRALKHLSSRDCIFKFSTHYCCCICICCCFHFCLLLQNHTWIVFGSTSSSFASSSAFCMFGDGSTSKYSFSLLMASGGNTVRFCRLKWKS